MSALPNSNSQQMQPNLHPVEIQLVALENIVEARDSRIWNASQAFKLKEELILLRKDINALKQEHDGCISAMPGAICDHCVAVIERRLHILLERDRASRRTPGK